jgi:flagellar assembly factor FliW
VNLQAPVAVDLVQRRAAQIVVSESAWTVREPLDLARLG